LRIGYPSIDAPKGLAAVQTMNRIERAFPQAPSPAEVVVTGTAGQDLDTPAVARPVAALQGRAAATGPVRAPVTVASVAGGRGLLISVPLAGSGSGTVSDHALVTLRNQILPSTIGQVPGLSYAVTGNTASDYDFTQQMHSQVPLVFAMVAGVAFVLLAVAFGSIAIPLVSILLNLLSVGAAYGLVTLIFQDGRLQGPLGYTSFGGIIAWEPLFMFVFLFGISMDYHVFLLSRIRGLRQRGASTREALVGGISSSAGVVTGAALIMVAVFSVFATLSLIDLKILGIGMAAVVLIDATVVRGCCCRQHWPCSASAPGRRPAGSAAGPSSPSPGGLGRARLVCVGVSRTQAGPTAATRASPTGVRPYSTGPGSVPWSAVRASRSTARWSPTAPSDHPGGATVDKIGQFLTFTEPG
jgi:putative drug exporter of the RND superfamily